jgi:glucose/arabinose dehydrogenase
MPARRPFASALALGIASLIFVPPAAAAPGTMLRAVPYVSGLSAPVAFVQDPADARVQFVVEQAGRIRTIVSGTLQSTPFLDIRAIVRASGEQGLLGLAFPPDAASSGRFFVNYTDLNGDTVVARYTRSADPRVANAASQFPLLWSTGERFIRQPFANHNGGCLAFGPDGFLYIGMGDGGNGNDPNRNAQNPASLLGKMLRIDVSVAAGHPAGFVVPASNPFVGVSGYRPEIWAVGLRNPWRFGFDDVGAGASGALLIGDVGQGAWEEIDYQPSGAGGRNYGWVVREGAHPTPGIGGVAPAFLPTIDPAYEYSHAVGFAVVGGYVYRGANLPSMSGRYFFADYTTGRVYSAQVQVNTSTREAALVDVADHTSALHTGASPGNISAFGRNATGELFLVDYSQGRVWLIASTLMPPANLRIIR